MSCSEIGCPRPPIEDSTFCALHSPDEPCKMVVDPERAARLLSPAGRAQVLRGRRPAGWNWDAEAVNEVRRALVPVVIEEARVLGRVEVSPEVVKDM